MNLFLMIGTSNTSKPQKYGVPVNQLSLIYLVKEQPVVKTRQKYPRYETQRVLVSALEATGKTKTGV